VEGPAPSRRSYFASGEVAMTSVYNGRIDTANKNEKKKLRHGWDGRSTPRPCWVILKGSPNKDAAYKFLDLSSADQPDGCRAEGLSETLFVRRACLVSGWICRRQSRT